MIADEDLFHEQEVIIRSYEVGPDHKIRVSQLVNFMQDAAWNHTIKMGVSIHDLQKKGLSWVLSRKRIEIGNLPEHQDTVFVETWPSGIEKFFFYRDFRIMNSERAPIVAATSTWLIFDMDSRKMVPVPEFLQNIPSNDVRDHLPFAKEKLPMVNKSEHSLDFSIFHGDMDINEHTNNANYFQWIVESVRMNFKNVLHPKVIDVQFRAESVNGDSMRIITEKIGDFNFIHKIINRNTQENVVLARTEWVG